MTKIESELESCDYSTARDQPFSGTVVPMKHYREDQRVQSILIEIHRWLYLKEHYSVDSERLEILVEILRRVGNMLENNSFFKIEGQIWMETQG